MTPCRGASRSPRDRALALASQLRDFSAKLEKYGMSVASNQIEYSLINRDREEDGTLEECRRMGKGGGGGVRMVRA